MRVLGRTCFAALVGLVFVAGTFAQTAAGGGREVARARAAHLRRGVNLSEWWAQVYDPRGYVKEHFESWTTAADLELIRKIGFDHVRLSVNPGPMFRKNEADLIPADYLAELDVSVKMILDSGLAVVLDLHPDEDFKQKLGGDAFVEEFADFWRAFAKHYSTWDAEKVFFETLNEPEVRDRYRWFGMETRLVEVIREAAPQHTVIVEGARWADNDDLVFMEPLRDGNVIYNFHFYEPHIFTHQGATWGENAWHYVRGLPYPSDPENVKAVAAQVPDEFNRLQVMRYGEDRWGPPRMNVEFDAVAEWAKRWDVAVVCNEFGVYRKAARVEDREAWIRDVRTGLEKRGIGWAMWDYSGGFGVVTKAAGQAAVVDEGTVKALGLKMP